MKFEQVVITAKSGERHSEKADAVISHSEAPVVLVDVRGFVITAHALGSDRLASRNNPSFDVDFRTLLIANDIPKFDQLLFKITANIIDDQAIEFHLVDEQRPRRFLARGAKGEGGTPFGVLFIAVAPQTDVSLEQENSSRWKVAVEGADQCVWDHDYEADIHFVSDTYREMRGWPPDRPIIKDPDEWLASLHPDDLSFVMSEVARIESGETDKINYEFRQRHLKGHWIWILARGRVTRRDEDGKPSRITGIDVDITKMKAQEEEKNRIGKRLSVAMAAANMAHWEMKQDAETIYWDKRALEIFGIGDGENTRPIRDFETALHPDDRGTTMTQWRSCISSRSAISCDFRIITPAGQERFIRTRGSYLSDSDGTGRFSGVYIDLTDDHQKTISLEKIRSRLEFESRHDPLTRLANRRRLDEVFQSLLAKSDGRTYGAMHIDVDHFKLINDTLGHDAGDATLKHVAQTVKKMVPQDALVSRIGGDEFAVLFPDVPKENALRDLAARLVNTLAVPFDYDGKTCDTGVSIGIATSGADAQLPSTLFIDADLALYHAKNNGRSTFSVYGSQMRLEAQRRQKAQKKLRHALENNELVCFYQPQFDAASGALSGLEALVRWVSPEDGLLTPAAFLGTAEEIGLSAAIDEFVLKQTLCDLKNWEADGLYVPRISVNVSAQRLADPAFGIDLQDLDIPPNKFSFELVESSFLDTDRDVVSSNLKAIRNLGVDIEIDDFGTGHASIVALLHVSPSRLKIDREFVTPILGSPKMKSLLEALIGIGKMLDIQVVAEGVETQELVPILTKMGCDYLQGYALGRPMPRASITPLLKG